MQAIHFLNGYSSWLHALQYQTGFIINYSPASQHRYWQTLTIKTTTTIKTTSTEDNQIVAL